METGLWDNNSFNFNPNIKFIYRIEKFDYFLKNLQNNFFTLVQPRKWDDPLEQIYLNKTEIILKDEEGIKQRGRFGSSFQVYYGSCWSLEGENYAKWMIYGNCNKECNKKYIQVKVNLKLLKNELETKENKLDGIRKIFYGCIIYLKKDKLINWMQGKDPTKTENVSSGNKDIIESFFVKRKEYEFEKEFRIIFQSDKNNQEKETLLCNWNNIIEEIIISPFANESEYNKIEQNLILENIPENKIKQSDLFKVPSKIIIESR